MHFNKGPWHQWVAIWELLMKLNMGRWLQFDWGQDQ